MPHALRNIESCNFVLLLISIYTFIRLVNLLFVVVTECCYNSYVEIMNLNNKESSAVSQSFLFVRPRLLLLPI